jgi:hypothetical protein
MAHMTETLVSPEDAAPALAAVHIIDCDAHFTEPPDLWSSRTAATMQDHVPVQKTVDGRTAWYLHDDVWATTGGNTITLDRRKIRGEHVIQPFDLVDKSAWAVKERLELLDLMGVYAQILYPNGIGFSSNHVFAIEDERERTAVLQVYNDFLVDVQTESKGRLLPQALLPIWDIDLTVTEMKRLIDKGITGFTLSDKPELIGLPELPEPYFAPMWDLFNESGTVANFHIGSGASREQMESIRANNTMPGTSDPKTGAPATVAATWRSLGRQRRLADPDVHEQRPDHREPVHERPLRSLREAQDRLG